MSASKIALGNYHGNAVFLTDLESELACNLRARWMITLYFKRCGHLIWCSVSSMSRIGAGKNFVN